MRTTYRKWSEHPYAGEQYPPKGSPEPAYWPMFFISRKEGGFVDRTGQPIHWSIRQPLDIDWATELFIVERTMHTLTPQQAQIATYWATGEVAAKVSNMMYWLGEAYRMGSPEIARISGYLNAAIHDTFVVTWHLKYQWDTARPNQYGRSLPEIMFTPRFPSYPSAHATVLGCAEAVFQHFFPLYSSRVRGIMQQGVQSRLYAGVHFPVDNEEGLKLGRQIGKIALQDFHTATS